MWSGSAGTRRATRDPDLVIEYTHAMYREVTVDG